MSRRKEPRGAVRDAPMLRTCETCGERGIAHTRSGRPYQAHLRGRRHRDAAERKRAEQARAAARDEAVAADEEHDEREGPEPVALPDHEAGA